MRDLLSVEMTQDDLRHLWNGLGMGSKVRNGYATFEPQPRYLTYPTTQVGIVRLPNGWIMGVAHRWRDTPTDEWSLPDPKRMWIDDASFYCW